MNGILKIGGIAAACLAATLLFNSWLKPDRDLANFPPQATGEWIAFGDSLTAGYGVDAGRDYPSLLGKRLGVSIRNIGVSGATTRDSLERVEEAARLKPRVVLLCLGGNDSLRSMPHDEVFANLAAIIDRFHQAGSFVVLIGIRSANVMDKYENRFERLAKEKGVLYVPNILRGVLGDPRLMADYIHPNEAGYAVIAQRLATELEPWLDDLK